MTWCSRRDFSIWQKVGQKKPQNIWQIEIGSKLNHFCITDKITRAKINVSAQVERKIGDKKNSSFSDHRGPNSKDRMKEERSLNGQIGIERKISISKWKWRHCFPSFHINLDSFSTTWFLQEWPLRALAGQEWTAVCTTCYPTKHASHLLCLSPRLLRT